MRLEIPAPAPPNTLLHQEGLQLAEASFCDINWYSCFCWLKFHVCSLCPTFLPCRTLIFVQKEKHMTCLGENILWVLLGQKGLESFVGSIPACLALSQVCRIHSIELALWGEWWWRLITKTMGQPGLISSLTMGISWISNNEHGKQLVSTSHWYIDDYRCI